MIFAKYRKKPVVIDAICYDASPGQRGYLRAAGVPLVVTALEDGTISHITTLEGDMRVSPGDWIIRGVNGEFYPCKPDIFEKTYESEAG